MSLNDQDMAQLEKLAQLKEKGVLTEEEFQEQKSKILYPKVAKSLVDIEAQQQDIELVKNKEFELKANEKKLTVQCLICKKEIPREVQVCPYCGYPKPNIGKKAGENKNIYTSALKTYEPEIQFSPESIRTIFGGFVFLFFFNLFISTIFFPWELTIVRFPIILVSTIIFILCAILFYRHWMLLQGHGARTTPGKAIGYFFIPFFNIYWHFFVFPALTTDNNSYMNREKIPGSRMNYDLSICWLLSRILYPISLFLLSIIYGIDPLNYFLVLSKLDTATLVALYLIFLLEQILFFIYIVKMKESILAILAFRKTT
jgi:hypothetical protein